MINIASNLFDRESVLAYLEDTAPALEPSCEELSLLSFASMFRLKQW